ncbi:MAG: 8-oxo-dGTP diphosphatase [Frankiaceae bacterium]|jgi:ADP-ribose pyrophosphatase YjhB (NUDIX family)|nr:8-oxo-dGTP diphosphatase [Frankiaceae bacterium]
MSPRSDAQKPHPVECAGAVVRDAEGRLLLVRRGHPPSEGLWSLPGGRIEPGESAAQAAAREAREETGLNVLVGKLLGTVDLWGNYRIHDFAATVVGGELRAGDDAAEVRWCSDEDVALMSLSPGLLDELRKMEER